MTREAIIELIKDNLQYECYNGFGISEYSINTAEIYDKADKLLALINKELSERLEKLHTEMDEKMREEVAIEKRMGEKKAENLLNQIEELTIGKCALRCPLVEQEKKEAIKDILIRLNITIEAETRPYIEAGTVNYDKPIRAFCVDRTVLDNKIENLAKEYGVEL